MFCVYIQIWQSIYPVPRSGKPVWYPSNRKFETEKDWQHTACYQSNYLHVHCSLCFPFATIYPLMYPVIWYCLCSAILGMVFYSKNTKFWESVSWPQRWLQELTLLRKCAVRPLIGETLVLTCEVVDLRFIKEDNNLQRWSYPNRTASITNKQDFSTVSSVWCLPVS